MPSSESEANDTPFAVLEVRDTGHGMTKEVQSRIFEPFFTTKQLGRGTGLGLSTVLGITERAGGHIEVQSEPEQGAIFRVSLPQVKAGPAVPLNVTSISLPAGGNETVLLAEDESGIRAMTRAYLESLGYRVLEAADGAEAIGRSLEYGGPIHLILTDLLMPGIRETRQLSRFVHIGLRSRQSSCPDMLINRCQKVTKTSYKPFEFPELGRRIRAVLDAGSGASNENFEPAAD